MTRSRFQVGQIWEHPFAGRFRIDSFDQGKAILTREKRGRGRCSRWWLLNRECQEGLIEALW